MIKEAYVSFEIAKLLKERGFDSECRYVYNNDGEKIAAQNFIAGESVVNNFDIDRVGETNGWITYLQGTYAFLCPTHQMAMAWLREVHNLFIELYVVKNYSNNKLEYTYSIQDLDFQGSDDGIECCKNWDTPEQACEIAIKYCLEKLI